MIYILCLICCLFSFLCGILFAMIKGISVKKNEISELTEADKLKKEKEKREYENFLKYDGSTQG